MTTKYTHAQQNKKRREKTAMHVKFMNFFWTAAMHGSIVLFSCENFVLWNKNDKNNTEESNLKKLVSNLLDFSVKKVM